MLILLTSWLVDLISFLYWLSYVPLSQIPSSDTLLLRIWTLTHGFFIVLLAVWVVIDEEEIEELRKAIGLERKSRGEKIKEKKAS
jgi:hypothetical protein